MSTIVKTGSEMNFYSESCASFERRLQEKIAEHRNQQVAHAEKMRIFRIKAGLKY